MNRLTSFKTNKYQRGDFLLGLMIAIVLASIISAAYWIDTREGNRDEAIKQSVKDVQMTGQRLQQNFGVNGQYGDVTTAVAVQSGAIPNSQRIRGTNTAQNAFGGAITAVAATLTSANDVSNLSYANVPPWACSKIVIGTQHLARQITVGATTVKPIDGVLVATDMTAACDVADPVTITWSIGRSGS